MSIRELDRIPQETAFNRCMVSLILKETAKLSNEIIKGILTCTLKVILPFCTSALR
jgi:hypothetical protein